MHRPAWNDPHRTAEQFAFLGGTVRIRGRNGPLGRGELTASSGCRRVMRKGLLSPKLSTVFWVGARDG